MKRIEAIICPEKVSEICAALEAIGQHGVTITAVEGRDSGQGWVHHLRGASYNDSVRARSRVEVVVRDEDANGTVRAINDAATTGGAGDGTIFIHDLADVIRIRTSESGVAAL